MDDLHNRRMFLRAAAAAGVAWATADLTEIEAALASAAQPASSGQTLKALTRAQADAVEALTGRILPAVDGRPGAREAGALYFIDRALASFNSGQKKLYTDGLADLDRRAGRVPPGQRRFVALVPAEQDELLRAIETSAFFQAVRFDTIVGTFGLPSLGGNRDYAGWHMIGFEHQPRFQAPFGYYDADVNRRR